MQLVTNFGLLRRIQSPDFYGILASQMVGRFGRKIGRPGKISCFLKKSIK
jgi:hypothetical protein